MLTKKRYYNWNVDKSTDILDAAYMWEALWEKTEINFDKTEKILNSYIKRKDSFRKSVLQTRSFGRFELHS